MKLLLDTHVFIWWVSDAQRLSPVVLSAFCDPANELLISIVSVWELQIKVQLGKLTLGQSLADTMDRQLQEPYFGLLNLNLQHLWMLEQLSPHHGDPFDRLLAAQATVEGMTLVTKDHVFQHYNVPLLW